MTSVQRKLKTLPAQAQRNKDILYVFGDLQDTPNNSKAFHYGQCRIPKHPLGIIKTCEDYQLECTIFKFLQDMDLPVISRHGYKGGRFIDGMYTSKQGLEHVTGITITHDTRILSDHDLVISKIDLGIKKYAISYAKEERVDFRSIMNIPVQYTNKSAHPVLNDNVFKGSDFKHHESLYHKIQDTTKKEEFKQRIMEIKKDLENLEMDIINRTRLTITPEDQAAGKLITRHPKDARRLNDASSEFFKLIQDVCRAVDLTAMVPIVPAASLHKQRQAIRKEKILPGIASIPLTRQLDDTYKRAKKIYQRLRILINNIITNQRMQRQGKPKTNIRKQLKTCARRFCNQQTPFQESIQKMLHVCQDVADDQSSHI